MKFSVVIPTVKQISLLFECVQSFINHHGKDHEIIIVEDGSDQATQLLVKERGEAMGCKVILSEKNCGFSTTVNKGIRASTGDVVIAVNNDITFKGPILDYLKEDMEKDPKIGIIGALLFYPNNTIQHGGIFRQGKLFGHRGYKKKYVHAPEVHEAKYLIGVTGALFAMRREFLDKQGLFREDFFLASEDTELCLRCWNTGWRVYYDPRIQAVHKEGETRGNDHQSKSLKGREWYKKELQTAGLFLSLLQKMDSRGEINKIEREVNIANLEKPKDRPPLVEKKADIKVADAPEPKKISDVYDGKVICLIRDGAFGDALFVTPIIREIKKRYPLSKVWVSTLCPDAFSGNVHVEKILSRKTDVVNMADAVFDLNLAYERDPKKHVVDAYSEYVFGEQIESKMPELHSGEHDLSMLKTKLSKEIMLDRDKIITMHMGVGWANRTWSRDSWIKVVRSLTTRGYKVCIVGKGGDYKSDLLMGVVNLNDKLSIREVRELIKKSVVFVGMDSGMLHVAQTTNTPIVSLFTVANPAYRMVRKDKVINLVPKSDCKFCLHEMPPPVTFVSCKYGHNNCLKEITPVEVIQSIGHLLGPV